MLIDVVACGRNINSYICITKQTKTQSYEHSKQHNRHSNNRKIHFRN